jgi:hypothetical protein
MGNEVGAHRPSLSRPRVPMTATLKFAHRGEMGEIRSWESQSLFERGYLHHN